MPQKNNNSSIFIPKQSLLFKNWIDNYKLDDKNGLPSIVNDNRLALIEASAGTGKTFALVELVLELILEYEIPLNKILLVTFTEKATSELKYRLRTKFDFLLKAFENKDDFLKNNSDCPFWEIDDTRKNLIKAALLDFDSAQIFTIHGFCKRILSEFAFENRQLFQLEYTDTKILFHDVFSRYIRNNLLSKKSSVSKLFSLYVKYNEGNIDSLRDEILNLLNREGVLVPNLPPFGEFENDFNKKWESLFEIDSILRGKSLDQHPVLKAFDFLSLKKNSKGKTIKNIKLLLNLLEESSIGKSVVEILPRFLEIELSSITNPKCKNKLYPGEKWLSQKEFPKQILFWIDELKECEKLIKKNNIFGIAKRILKVWLIQNVLQDIRFELTKIKLERGLFDFDDLLTVVEQELFFDDKENRDLTPLTMAVRKKYLCAIVDEFQDTDRRQWSIFSRIFLESSLHRLILIGDPKQSIYSFRGADIFTYLKAKKLILEKTSKPPFVLKENFRSSEKMIFGLNKIFNGELWFPKNKGIDYYDVKCGNSKLELIGNDFNRKAIHLLELNPQFTISLKKIENYKKKKNSNAFTGFLEKLKKHSGEKYFGEEGFLKMLTSKFGRDIVSKNKNNFLNLFLDDHINNATLSFADTISVEIKNLLGTAKSGQIRPVWKQEDLERTINENDICILFRKTSEGEVIAKSLKRHGIDFVFYKQKGLFSCREAKEILDLLQAIANPKDYSRLGKLWLTRFFEVDLKELQKSDLRNSKISYLLKDWNSLAEKRNFGKLFENILSLTRLLERELFFGGDERSVTNYLHLFELMNRLVLEKNLNLFELIQLFKGVAEGKDDSLENENLLRIESERNAVQLMTMHSSKGLEFPIVFLFGGFTGDKSDGAKFYYNSDDDEQIIDLLNYKIPEEHKWQEESEQQRLLYVAMTRARGRLYLPYIGFLSSDPKRRVCKIKGIYSVLNEELSSIMKENFSNMKEFPFSISAAKTYNKNKKINFNSNKNLNIKKWNPTKLIEKKFFFQEKNNQKKIFDEIRFKKRGFVVNSFSKLKRKEKEYKDIDSFRDSRYFSSYEIRNEGELGELRENDEFSLDILKDSSKQILNFPLTQKEDQINLTQENQKYELRGGVKIGNLFHDLLESLDFSTMANSNSIEEWISKPSVRRFFEIINENYGLPKKIITPLAAIIWKALSTKIRLGKSKDSPVLKLANIKQELREVDFYFPIQKTKKGDNFFLREEKSMIEGWHFKNGFLHGSIDLLFKYNGKIYFLDWKSNILEKYNPEYLEEVIIEHYELQLQIYTLATCYWFKINFEEKYKEKFGGAIFLFLRGVGDFSSNIENVSSQANNGVFFNRPSWEEFLNFEKKLSLLDF